MAMAQLRICCRGSGAQAKVGVSGTRGKDWWGKPAGQGALEVSDGNCTLQGAQVPGAHPYVQRVGAWSHSKAELPTCSCWRFIPSPCSPEDALSCLRKKWCPALKCPLWNVLCSIFYQLPGVCSPDLSLLLCSSPGVFVTASGLAGCNPCPGWDPLQWHQRARV